MSCRGQIVDGPHALCACCKLPTPFMACGQDEAPALAFVLSKGLIHRILKELIATAFLKQPRWSAHRAKPAPKAKEVFRCKYCWQHCDMLYWFSGGGSYSGGFCGSCAEREIVANFGHEEDGVTEKAKIIGVPIRKPVLDLVASYRKAFREKELDVLMTTPVVTEHVENPETEEQLF